MGRPRGWEVRDNGNNWGQGNKLTGDDMADCVRNEYWMANFDKVSKVDGELTTN